MVNAGSIGTGYYASIVMHNPNAANRLVIDPGATFAGRVLASGTSGNTIELGAGTGTLANLANYQGFQGLRTDAGGAWSAGGDFSFTNPVIDQGQLTFTGSILSQNSIDGGITIAAGASLKNSGTISRESSLFDFAADVQGGHLDNAGVLTSAYNFPSTSVTIGFGVGVSGGGTLVNEVGASIRGAYSGAFISGGSYLRNLGFIGDSTNGSGVAALDAGDTVVNAGTIAGSSDSVYFSGGDTLIIDPGAVFTGSVAGRLSSTKPLSTLELAGAGTGTLSGLGSVLTGFGDVRFGGGADWTLGGSAAGLSASITGFVRGDTIDLTGFTETGFTYTAQGLVLSGTGGPDTVGIQGNFTTNSFAVADVAGNTQIELAVTCFVAGTRIATPRGERPVETLRVGDLVVTVSGHAVPVVWLGRRKVDCARHPRPQMAWPICIAPEAFGPGMPERELFLSPDHAVFWMDRLVPVKLLINGATIRQVARPVVAYHHIELARHDLVLADGLPAETYLDTGNRTMFEAEGQPLMLYPDFAMGQRGREALSCAPFAHLPVEVEPVWRDLAERAEAMGWRLPEPSALTDDPDPHLVIGGRRVNPVAAEEGRYLFLLPAGEAPIRLVSRSARPSDARPWVSDDRILGVAVGRIRVRQGSGLIDLALDATGFEIGWCDVERENGRMWRWTNGDALLRPPAPRGPGRVLELTICGGLSYRLHSAAGNVPEPLAAIA